MRDMLMSQTGFWVSFTILFVLIVMAWFFFKMLKLSKEKRIPLEEKDS